MKELPTKGLIMLSIFCNSILRLEHFPCQWKVVQLIMSPKPVIPPNLHIFDKLFLTLLLPMLTESRVCFSTATFNRRTGPSSCEHHQERFKETIHICSAAFLDIVRRLIQFGTMLFRRKSNLLFLIRSSIFYNHT